MPMRASPRRTDESGHLRDADEFLNFYLKCLRDAVFVDISDFPIRERRRFFGPALVALKK